MFLIKKLLKGGVPVMKERGRKKTMIKNICTLVIASVLICCSFSAFTTTAISHLKQDNNLNTLLFKSKNSQVLSVGYVDLLDENFTDGNIPPKGVWGDWELRQTNANQTWYIDTTVPHTTPYCGTIHRNGSQTLQDEWLITPSINFSQYTQIYLKFYWYTCYYVTVYKKYVDFNVSVSTDGGTNWTKIWSFNSVGRFFHDWIWYNTILPNYTPIDLSAYAGKKDVKIAFQYHSNNITSADFQEFSIDDILIYASGPDPIACNAGGPYEWWWPMQYDYTPAGVRFKGNVTGATLGTQWLWDFGDGITSAIPYYPIHLYNDIGTYNVTLTVKDNTTSPPRIAFDSTTVNLFLIEPPEMEITVQRMSLGIKTDIKNSGDYNASFVNWTMKISWGPLQIIEKKVANGTLDNILAGSTTTIRSPLYFFGFGRIHIIISVYPENIPGVVKHYNGLKLGPLVFVFNES